MGSFRRATVALGCAVLAVSWVLGVPSSSAQSAPALNYTIRTSGADLSHAKDGDPLRVTISGLPPGATANFKVCPTPLPDGLIKVKFDPATRTINADGPNHDVGTRWSQYCGNLPFNDELSGSVFTTPVAARSRSAATGDIVFDTYVPRGSATGFVANDPNYTQTVKSSTFTWPNNPGQRQFTFTCDETHPCALMMQIIGTPPGGTRQIVYDDSVRFAAAAPGIRIEGCGGLAPSTLTASTPERFARTAVSWNQLLCAPTAAPQPTNVVSEAEDAGLNSFDTGDTDLMVTGSGGALASQRVRQRQYIPVALNATVIAAIGWSPTDRDDLGNALKSRMSADLKFGWDDIADMLSKGGQNPDTTGRGGIFHNDAPLVQRNPELTAISGTSGTADAPQKRAGYFGDPTYYGVTGEAGKSTVPLSLSSMLSGAAPGSWVFGTTSSFAGKGGKPVGTVTDLNELNVGQADVHNVDAKSGRINARKAVNLATLGIGDTCVNGCLNWVVTDLASATEYGWTPVAVPNGHGGYVAPTPQSLQAAASRMKVGTDGSLTPGDTSGDPNAYPLTFVESLAAPVNPIVSGTCQVNQAKQAQLATFVKAATDGGQSAMGPGMVPLTGEVLARARDAAGKVGTGTAAAACTEQQAARNAAASLTQVGNDVFPAGAGGFGGTAGALGTADGFSSALPAGGLPGEAAKAPTAASTQEAKNVADSTRIPLTTAGVLGALIPLLALAILVLLPSATGYLSAGRPIPPWLRRFLERIDPRNLLRGRA